MDKIQKMEKIEKAIQKKRETYCYTCTNPCFGCDTREELDQLFANFQAVDFTESEKYPICKE